MFPWPSYYELRARIAPALIAIIPALALAGALISWTEVSITNAFVALSVVVLLFVSSDVARRMGKTKEPKIFQEMGAMPSTLLLRKSDQTFDEKTKNRYVSFLAKKLSENGPDLKGEIDYADFNDGLYTRCATWLRERTRDTKKFKILFAENVTYGFRRNLYGVKSFGLGLNVLVVIACWIYLWLGPFPDIPISRTSLANVLVIAVLHAFYLLTVATRKSVKDGATQYGRQLILCCEAFIGDDDIPVAKVRSKKN